MEGLRIEQKTAHQRKTSGEHPEGLYRMSGYDGYFDIQPGAENHSLRLLGPCQTEMVRIHADGATVKNSKVAVGFQYCMKRFSLKKKYIYADIKARKDYRQNVVRPFLEEYFTQLKTIHPEKGSNLEDALRYSLNQKQQLMAFLDYGDVPISNNLAKNAICPFVVGRKKAGCSETAPNTAPLYIAGGNSQCQRY